MSDDGMIAPPPPPPPFLPPKEAKRHNLVSQQVQIQVVLLIVFILYTAILIFGRLRSRGGGTIKMLSTTAFTLTGHLVSYLPGLMSSSGQSNHLYVFWFCFVTYLAAVANEISSYTLVDNEARKKRLVMDYFVPIGLVLSFFGDSLALPTIIVPIGFVFWVVILKLRERSHALLYATTSSNGLTKATRVISDFTKYQKDYGEVGTPNSFYNNLLVGVVDAKKMMSGSRVPESDLSMVITLDDVFDPNQGFLVSTNAGMELQNTCTSFAMFWVLLATKIAGFQTVDPKIFKTAHKIPLGSFDLVEKELDFLYEYLFTNYFAIYDRGLWRKVRDLCVISMFFWITMPLLIEYRPEDYNALYVVLWKGVLDIGFTRFVILGIVFMEFIQVSIFLTSKWAKVMYTCAYLREHALSGGTRSTKSNILEWVVKIVCWLPRPGLSCFCLKTFTKRKMSQYTLLDNFVAIPKEMWAACWIGRFYDVPSKGQGGVKNASVSWELKQSFLKAIETHLERHEGVFTNGVFALKDSSLEEDVKKVSSQARAILIWHIATSYLEDAEPTHPINYGNDIKTAIQLSKYCAYLVAFVPKILSDHVDTTQREFDEAVKELEKGVFDDDDDDDEDPKAGLNGEFSFLQEAEKLKGKLEQHPNKWKILAEFWTEMVMFLALSDHPDAIQTHANSLCKGGEFITHLWALATHAGCSNKLIKASSLYRS